MTNGYFTHSEVWPTRSRTGHFRKDTSAFECQCGSHQFAPTYPPHTTGDNPSPNIALMCAYLRCLECGDFCSLSIFVDRDGEIATSWGSVGTDH